MNTDALIVGGSTAGLQAALDLADSGIKVHLIETSPFLGKGSKATIPSHQSGKRILEITKHANIDIWTNTQLNRVQREAGGWRIELRSHPRHVDLTKCTACGDCVAACPVMVPGTNHKAIHLDGQPGCMAIEKTGKAPCANTCPGGIHVQGYVALLAQGRFQEAIDLIREAIPFPGICGRVCTHPCEINCRRAEVDKPVAIRLLKRFLADWELAHGENHRTAKVKRPAPGSPKVAVIGAGPGGMAVAERLARLGYRVTVFEKLPVIGGMMAAGIPEYRLPRQVIAREYQQILELGVEIQLNTAIGPEGKHTLEDLFQMGYAAVCLAVGAHKSQTPGIPGEELPGVVHGIELLKAINLSRQLDEADHKNQIRNLLHKGSKSRAAVLGGGNTAMDAARSLRRLGVKDVRILYRRTRKEMPAMAEEIEETEYEGVVIDYLVAPVRILGNKKTGVTGLECTRMKLGEPDASGRRRPVPIAGSEFIIKLDLVVLALGQSPDLDFLGENHGIAITRDARINVAQASFATSRPGVFAVGDAVTSDKMVVIEAIGMGKQAAAAIDAYLHGQQPQEVVVDAREAPIACREMKEEELLPSPRLPVPSIDMQQRLSTFDEIELGYSAEEAIREARRCLVCGPCSECHACVRVCKPGALIPEQQEMLNELEVGAIIVADDSIRLALPSPAESQGIYRVAAQDPVSASAAAAGVLQYIPQKRSPKAQTANPAAPAGMPRAGIFICQCGDDIAQVINVQTVCKKASSLPGVVHAQVLSFSCSPEAAGMIQRAVQEHRLNRVVLAACACCADNQVCFSCTYQRLRCKQNLGLFTHNAKAGSLQDAEPLAAFELVNIREQCAWVHAADAHKATAKAIRLVAGATARVCMAQAAPAGLAGGQPVEPSVLILGSGAAASACRKALKASGLTSKHVKNIPLQIKRSGGAYVAARHSQTWKASALVLTPGNSGEANHLLDAFGQERLRPRPVADWGGLETHRPGIYHCDPGQDPVKTGSAAAVRVAAWLGQTASRPTATARVNTVRCRACATCVELCEFGAVELAGEAPTRAAQIDPAICTGCGTCAAHCPSGAITAGYAPEAQLEAMLEAMLA